MACSSRSRVEAGRSPVLPRWTAGSAETHRRAQRRVCRSVATVAPSPPSLLPAPRSDADVPAYWRALGLPGLADIHVHFLPQPMLAKVWAYFDQAEEHYGQPWPIHYRDDEATRIATLRALG